MIRMMLMLSMIYFDAGSSGMPNMTARAPLAGASTYASMVKAVDTAVARESTPLSIKTAFSNLRVRARWSLSRITR